MEVSTTVIIQFMASAFYAMSYGTENPGYGISGVEAAYRALRTKWQDKENIKFVSFGGDSGTYDIGLQSLSRRSPKARTSPIYRAQQPGIHEHRCSTKQLPQCQCRPRRQRRVIHGKLQRAPEDLTEIVAAHHPSLCEQTTPVQPT